MTHFLISSPLILIIPLLMMVAFFTLLERKVLSLAGSRVGPNKVSVLGLLQPISDAVKLSNKSVNLLSNTSTFFYYLSSGLMIFSTLLLFSSLYIDPSFLYFKFSLILLLLVLGFNSFNGMISGWSTFSKFSLLGSLRTVSQLVSYEASLYLCLFMITVFYFSFDLQEVNFFHLPFFFILIPFMGYLWIPVFLAELNRTPYDFSEGESELVSGFNTEFGSCGFTLIFLAEYGNILFFSLISGLFFLSSFFGSFIFFFFVIWIRSVLPRYRFDKLMSLCWKFMIPFLTCLFLFYYPLSF